MRDIKFWLKLVPVWIIAAFIGWYIGDIGVNAQQTRRQRVWYSIGVLEGETSVLRGKLSALEDRVEELEQRIVD